MSIATKSISSYLPIRARTNRTRSWLALRTPYRWSACATTATSPNQDGVLGEFVGSTWMWTTGSVIFLSSLSHSFSLRKTHFCRLCQFFRAFFPSSAHSLRIPWAEEPDHCAQELSDIERVARQTLREVREAVAGYRQPRLESELEGARQLLSAAGADVQALPRSEAPSPETSAVLAWTVREGVTNVIRHSRA